MELNVQEENWRHWNFKGDILQNPSTYASQRVGFNSFPNPKNGLSRASRTSQILKQEFLVKWRSIKAASKCFAYLEKFNLNFSSLSLVNLINLHYSLPSLILYSLLLSLWCFSVLVNYYFQVSFNLKIVLYVAKIIWNTMSVLL